MVLNFKEINIGNLLQICAEESIIDISRICNFMKCTENEVKQMYLRESLPTDILLRWSKLLEYDFFRVYTQHLILYAPSAQAVLNTGSKVSKLPRFRKNIYTKEIIDFILGQIESAEMTKAQAIERYKIPKTTLYKWISKYNTEKAE